MADTKTISTTTLTSQESIQFIRPNNLKLTLIEARPNTKVYVFFDNENVTDKCHPASIDWTPSTTVTLQQVIRSGDNYYQVTAGGITDTTAPSHVLGSAVNGTATLEYVSDITTLPLITDTIGQLVIQFNLPGGVYTTGNKTITIADTPILSQLETTNSVFGSAKATFHATGRLDIFQETQTTITTVERTVNVYKDPLAQSFFTYGVSGGIFLSSVDIFFQTKDDTIPVRLEIRGMVNGYPSPLDMTSRILVSVLEPSQVNISSDASAATKFTFNPPIYLKEESEYCFVLRSNSNNYNVFTSRMGEASLEDGRKIFEQPYIGSLFKSENNVTWTAEQFEDVKFTLNKCVFDTSTDGVIELAASVPAIGAMGNQFTTTAGSNIITYRHNHDHGLEVGSLFHVVTRTDELYADATFNGIPYSEFNNTHTVLSVPDRNTITFAVDTNANSTGPLTSADIVTYINVSSGGMNYSSTDTVSITGGGGSDAAATLTVVDGAILSVNITNAGSGYNTAPQVVVNTSTGSGASLTISVLPTFSVYVNKPMTGFTAKINTLNFSNNSSSNTIRTTIGNYDGGNLVTYNDGVLLDFKEYVPYINIGQNSLIASYYNEQQMMAGNPSSVVGITLSTNNPNISPLIDFNTKPLLHAHYNKINSQSGETISSTSSSGTVDTIVVTSAGTGYTVDPNVIISAPDLEDGVQATATASRTGSAVSSINVNNAGSGYTSVPLVTITRGDGDTTGGGAAGQVVLTPFNSELLPTGGTARARYITKRATIQIVSTGIRIYSSISSGQGSSVDWYVRTSLSGSNVDHEEQPWKLLSCDVSRNKSSFTGQMFDYEFYLNDISDFDVYDLKCVMTAQNPTQPPVVDSYRVIVIA